MSFRTNRRTGGRFPVGSSPTVSGERVLGTTRRGKTPITSKEQLGYLHFQELDHTHFSYKNGKIVRKSRHVY